MVKIKDGELTSIQYGINSSIKNNTFDEGLEFFNNKYTILRDFNQMVKSLNYQIIKEYIMEDYDLGLINIEVLEDRIERMDYNINCQKTNKNGNDKFGKKLLIVLEEVLAYAKEPK